ncbi:hypothetical protein [Pseudomonas fluorescens]|uniref:Uncharacterized protein n=1 Tax=Pseudomonas fluorescens TaxID=294 RepID=A0AAE2U2R5_PSEFL|nr:hypothetical protein [Pseudomonas fluorescens]MBD8268373.1 hypothetical protein [Pseudomonas fluorescens]
MTGIMEIYDFGQVWRGKTNFQVMPVGNFLFCASITYTSVKRGTEQENCTVMMVRNGMGDGEVNIYEKGCLTANTHHLGLKHQYQTYKFDRTSNSFVITGNSSKMGGDYVINISPNGLVPSFI